VATAHERENKTHVPPWNAFNWSVRKPMPQAVQRFTQALASAAERCTIGRLHIRCSLAKALYQHAVAHQTNHNFT
jgi:hypothetical protein